MDEHVLRGVARWPDVPAVYGWLGLNRRGVWLLQGEPISNPVVVEYIARNYERDAEGRWFFQNGPQRVYVELDYTPIVYRALIAVGAPLHLQTHTGHDAVELRGAWIDETGTLVFDTEHGVGLLHDQDLEATLPHLLGESGDVLSEAEVEEAVAVIQQGTQAPVWIRVRAATVKVEPLRSTEVPRKFGFVRRARRADLLR